MKPKNKTTSPIDHFELRYHLNPGLSDAAVCDGWAEQFPATRAGLAFALDKCGYKCLELKGSHGDAHATVYAIMGDGDRPILEANSVLGDDAFGNDTFMPERRAGELLLIDGTLNARNVHALRENVWNGHNHVPFTPSRSLRFLSGEDAYERKGHALVQWNEDGGTDDIRLDEGWAVADEYWGTLGNEPYSHGNHDTDERETLLTDAGIEYDLVWLSDDDLMFLVRIADVERAQAVFDKSAD